MHGRRCVYGVRSAVPHTLGRLSHWWRERVSEVLADGRFHAVHRERELAGQAQPTSSISRWLKHGERAHLFIMAREGGGRTGGGHRDHAWAVPRTC